MRRVCRHTGWACGFVYLPCESDTSRLKLSPSWYANGEGIEPFVEATISLQFPLESRSARNWAVCMSVAGRSVSSSTMRPMML